MPEPSAWVIAVVRASTLVTFVPLTASTLMPTTAPLELTLRSPLTGSSATSSLWAWTQAETLAESTESVGTLPWALVTVIQEALVAASAVKESLPSGALIVTSCSTQRLAWSATVRAWSSETVGGCVM